MTTTDQYGWYVLVTVPIFRIEFKVAEALNQRELAALAPFETKWVRSKKGRNKLGKFPLCPRYVFVQLPTAEEKIAEECHLIKKHIEGVQGMLSRSRTEFDPVVLRASDVEIIKTWSQQSVIEVDTHGIHKAFQPGGSVTILKGPLAGQVGKIDAISRRRIRVLLHMLGSMRVIDVTAADLAVA